MCRCYGTFTYMLSTIIELANIYMRHLLGLGMSLLQKTIQMLTVLSGKNVNNDCTNSGHNGRRLPRFFQNYIN